MKWVRVDQCTEGGRFDLRPSAYGVYFGEDTPFTTEGVEQTADSPREIQHQADF